jgi:hypothetical protein
MSAPSPKAGMVDDKEVCRRLEARRALLTAKIELADLGPDDDADDIIIFALLGGRIHFDRLNRPTIRYPDKEQAARRALVGRLRGDRPLSRELRDLLAALFDPDQSELADGTPVRQLVFKFRKGRKLEFHRNLMINLILSMQTGAGISINDALGRTGQIFGMESEAIRKIRKPPVA